MQKPQTYKAWFEKHRPKTINELIFPKVLNGENKDSSYIKSIFEKFYNQEFIQGNVLSYGPGGFGKTSLNKILYGKIIKNPGDIFILGRKVEDVDKLLTWLQQKAISSNQKIVVIEEIDRLSNQAQLILKDGPLEKYQERVSFLATTNNPEKLDQALVTRFNYRLYFQELDVEQASERMQEILKIENIEFNPEDVTKFVNIHIKRGLRELISNLEINSVTGKFIFDAQKALNLTGNEDYIIQTIIYLLNYLKSNDKSIINNIMTNVEKDQHFNQYYQYILKLIKEDLLLNYDYIYKKIIDNDNVDFALKNIFIDDYQMFDNVKMKNFYFLGTFSKAMKEIYTLKNLA